MCVVTYTHHVLCLTVTLCRNVRLSSILRRCSNVYVLTNNCIFPFFELVVPLALLRRLESVTYKKNSYIKLKKRFVFMHPLQDRIIT